MARTKNIVDFRDYYSNAEAVDRLRENSGHPINPNYPRYLARKGLIRSLDFGARGKLYLKEDVNRYVVSSKRGPKPKQEKMAATA